MFLLIDEKSVRLLSLTFAHLNQNRLKDNAVDIWVASIPRLAVCNLPPMCNAHCACTTCKLMSPQRCLLHTVHTSTFAKQPVSQHFAFAFDRDLPSGLENEGAKQIEHRLGRWADVNLEWLTVHFHSTGDIDSISEETVSGHLVANHTGSTWTRVDADA